jgi:hypothetical protein
MPGISAGIQGAVGIAKTVTNLVNAGKAKKEAKELARTRPQYKVDKGYGQNLSLAESNLQGLSDTAENAYNQLQDKQFSSSLDAILKSGGTASNVADVYGQGEEGRLRLAQLNDQMRMSQINNVMQSRQQMADQNDKAFEFNQWRPWADKSQANAQARQGAEEGIWNGIQTVGSAGMQFADQTNANNQYEKYLKTIGGKTGTNATPNGVAPSYSFNPSSSRQGINMPTSSFNTPNLPKYNSGWQMSQDTDYLTQILNKPV